MTIERGFEQAENRAMFEARIGVLIEPEFESVMYAYDLAKAVHVKQAREGGERYFEHPRNVALILLDECKINDPIILASALLHDTLEDSRAFGTGLNKTYQQWSEKGRERLSRTIDPDVADIVVAVSKPPAVLLDILSEDDALNLYYENLKKASPKAKLVKMADRLHNLRTQGATSKEKQIRKIYETREHYYKIFEGVKPEYPDEYDYLISKMEEAISGLNL